MHFFALLLVLKIDFADVYVLGLQGAFECDGIENTIPLICYPLFFSFLSAKIRL